MNVLVTGCCGFIGYNLADELLRSGCSVTGVDNLNSYYNVRLKARNMNALTKFDSFSLHVHDIRDMKFMDTLFKENGFDCVINLAAQAGVSGSLTNPLEYVGTNIDGFANILECCKVYGVKKLIYASSSSVYGDSDTFPMNELLSTDKPISLYAATKKCDEILAESYSNMFGLKCIGVRLFTVYGPCGRPDMAPAIFTERIFDGQPITLYNNGYVKRDFTYVGDVVKAISMMIGSDIGKKHEIYNIGSSSPAYLLDLIGEIERNVGKTVEVVFKPHRNWDARCTFSDCTKLGKDYGYTPDTSLADGIRLFVDWFRENRELYQDTKCDKRTIFFE